jgi:hypothetical protein
MTSRKRTNVPGKLDKVWDQAMPQPNGYVIMVNYDVEEITVKFYDDAKRGIRSIHQVYSFDDFYGKYDALHHGGIWMLHEEESGNGNT